MSNNSGRFNKVLRHPDKEDIIKKLLEGDSLKSVERYLKKKYPGKKRLHISWVTLQKFRKEHLNLHGQVLDDIKNARSVKDKNSNEALTKQIVAQSDHYQKKINEIADAELDAEKRLLEMDKLVNARLVYYFNLLESGQGNLKGDKVFLEYIKEYRAILESWKKFIEGHADKKVEHNININVVNEQLNVLKSIIFEVLQEMDPMLVPIFVDKLNSKMDYIDVGTDDYKRLGIVDAEVIDE